MLILTGRPSDGPFHYIDDDTGVESTIEVLKISGNQVVLGFNIPDNVTILRDKVYQEEDND